MKNFLPALLFVAFTVAAQQKDYKPLLEQLNEMLENAEEFNYGYGPEFGIVQPYQVDAEGNLSVIISGTEDGQPIIHKYEAPLRDMKDLVRDIYLVLTFHNESVAIYEKTKNDSWEVVSKRDYFHLGKPDEGYAPVITAYLRKALNDLYPLENEFQWMD